VAEIFLLAGAAALNPALLAATTLMLVMPSPKKLLLYYLFGAAVCSVTIGCVIVFAVGGETGGTSTAEHTINPIWDAVLGALILVIAFIVGTGRDTRWRARAARKKAEKANQPPPRWQRALRGGSGATTFAVGALLTLPGASYLAALALISKQDLSVPSTVLTIVAFNVVMLLLLEIPLIGYTLSPDKTAATVQRFKAWLARNGGRIALIGAIVVGVVLFARGVIAAVS
jgi:hypothetical protein